MSSVTPKASLKTWPRFEPSSVGNYWTRSTDNSRTKPARETRNRKILRGLTPPWEHLPPVWELRVNEYRVFYDVDEAAGQVVVRAVRRKPPHKTTEEIL